MRKLTLFLSVCLLSLLTVEGILTFALRKGSLVDPRAILRDWLYAERNPSSIYLKQKELKYIHRSNSQGQGTTKDFQILYEINALGMRDPERPLEKLKQSPEIYLAVGDSFTFGEGVPLPLRFSDRLSAQFDLPILNAGVSGWGLEHILVYLQNHALPIPLKGVLVFVNMAMLERPILEEDDSGNLLIPTSLSPTETIESPAKIRALPFWSFVLASKSLSLFSLLALSPFEGPKLALAPPDGPSEEFWESDGTRAKKVRQRAIRAVSALRKLAQQRGWDLWMISLEPNYSLDFLAPDPQAQKWISLGKALHDRGQTQNLRFTFDRHFNSLTHEFIATELAIALREKGFRQKRR